MNLKHNLTPLLTKHFGYSDFRENQHEIINSILQNENTLVIMPTGGGKSLCYQLSAIASEGTAIIISPLIALMKNQVDVLKGLFNIDGVANVLNSSLTKSDVELVKDQIKNGITKLLYMAPESLTKQKNIDFLKDQKITSLDEEESPFSPYHLSKAIGEELCRYFNKEYGVHCQNLRLFSIYGKGQPASSLVPTVIQQVTGSCNEIRVQSVDAIRDFIHVDDVINAIESAITINPPGFSSYQIGSGQGTSVKELIALIQSIAGSDKPVATVGGFHEKDRKRVVAQTDECAALGWRAEISLREGLQMLLPRFKSSLGT